MAIQAHLYTTYPVNATGFPSQQDLITDFNSQQQTPHHQLASSVKPLQQHLLYYNQTQTNQTMSANHALLLANNYNSNHPHHHLSTPNSQISFAVVEFENQRSEVDHYIKSQLNERLRLILQEQRKQQVAAILKKVEAEAVRMLRQKDEEIAQAAKKRAELEEYLSRAEADNVWWRRVAQEKEGMVMSLHNSLEQMQKQRNGMETEDAESWCDEGRRRRGEEGTGENGEGGVAKMVCCRRCSSSSSIVMFLPCRHLCSCKACEPFLDACPVCRIPKKSTIETLLF